MTVLMSDLMNGLQIRPYDAADQSAVSAVYQAARPLGMGPPEAKSDFKLRYVAWNSRTENIVGYAAGGNGDPSNLSVMVHPERQRQAIGTRLWEHLREAMTADGIGATEAWVREENAPAVAWLKHQGFTQTKQDGPVRLVLSDAQGADLAPFESVAAALAAQGLTLTTLAEETERDPHCLPKLYELYTTVEADTPWGDSAVKPSLADFSGEWGRPGKLLFLAKDGDRYVGLSTAAPRGADAFFEERHDIFQQHLTGVRREYRRRGIATALKRQIIAHAKAGGYGSLWTNSDNPAMRALNRKLGFRTGPWLVYHQAHTQEATHDRP